MTVSSNQRSTLRAGIGLLAFSAAVALAGCATGASTPESSDASQSQAGQCAATADNPVTLEYWSWGNGYAEATALWNEEHPEIQVNYSDVPVGNAGGYQKMFNAVKSGTAPDIGFLESDNIAAFGSQGYLADVSQYVPAEVKADFLAPAMNQASLGIEDAMFNVPIGGGPMALIYRKDLFDQNGLAVPTTWAEFEETAAKVHEIDANAVLANFDGYGNANWFAGLASQNGAQWFTAEDAGWKVTINADATSEVADLWQRMIDAGTAGQMTTFSPEWTAALADGQIWSWPTAVWGTGIIKTANPDNVGAWAVAPLPTWNEGESVSATWGGGGLSVFASSEHPCEAAEFALWMGTSAESLAILNEAFGVFPTTNTLLAEPIFAEPDEFFGGQKIFEVFRESAETTPAFTWGPAMTDTYTAVTDGFSNAKTSGQTLPDSLNQAQDTVVTSLEKDGFTVSR